MEDSVYSQLCVGLQVPIQSIPGLRGASSFCNRILQGARLEKYSSFLKGRERLRIRCLPLSLASVGCRCACRKPEETTGILNEESGKRCSPSRFGDLRRGEDDSVGHREVKRKFSPTELQARGGATLKRRAATSHSGNERTQSFSSEKLYYEVQVKGKSQWLLGVARESINRKVDITVSPLNGYWTIWLSNGNEYKAAASPSVVLSLKSRPQKVGVFVDYEEGLVSFYDVEAAVLIYSFTGCSFKEKLLPFFYPGLYHDGRNSAPLIITPVGADDSVGHREVKVRFSPTELQKQTFPSEVISSTE
ncbi:Pyrin [Liparis tanakae]|uniref:Pyrin n=1 Tax=Liparis tanakae TaxID=230148 RepID=A0A4Z2G677_9TELE|nr:Pyrin [Liparis tanakae]